MHEVPRPPVPSLRRRVRTANGYTWERQTRAAETVNLCAASALSLTEPPVVSKACPRPGWNNALAEARWNGADEVDLRRMRPASVPQSMGEISLLSPFGICRDDRMTLNERDWQCDRDTRADDRYQWETGAGSRALVHVRCWFGDCRASL